MSARHADQENGFLIIETNYKVYAYTSNPLQIAVLNLFVGLKSRFPNLVTGVITRDSVKKGLTNGITANQVSHIRSHGGMELTTMVDTPDHQLPHLSSSPTDAKAKVGTAYDCR